MATLIAENGTGVYGANSYATEADADLYFEKRLHTTTWDDAGDAKEIALMWATRLLDEHVNWFGYITYDSQPLRWPRTGLTDMEERDIDADGIPAFLIEATAELALYLIGEDTTLETNRDLIGLKKVTIDTLSITTDSSTLAIKSVIPASVWSMIKFYGQPYGGTRRLGRC